jgi:inositol-phosphate phosphatase / L-galactose 1-phosphate phosphatase / histidinol-phosphatase
MEAANDAPGGGNVSSTEQNDLRREFALAQRLADAARPIALSYFRRPLAIERKADLSPVTVADRAIESALRSMIREHFPAHGIFGEEFGSEPGTEFTWVLDPIDGTKSFISGLPLFGTLIALLRDEQPVLGVIEIPATAERWLGRHGSATQFNGRDIRASACASIADARIVTTSPNAFSSEDWRRFDALSSRAAVRRFGGDCYGYGLLASGHCDLVIEAGLAPYDYLALVTVIEGAGGKISDWNGAALGLTSDGRVVAAANESLWNLALEGLA